MMKKTLVILLALLMLTGVLGACSSKSGDTVVVASKQFTENIILGEVYAQLVEAKTDLKVECKLNLGGTSVIMPAMESGEVDFYFEYTGTICYEILKIENEGGITADYALETATEGMQNDHSMTFFTPVGLNNTYSVLIPRAKAQELGVSKLSELKDHAPELAFGATHTFYARISDGYDSLTELYELSFRESKKMDQTLMYEATSTGELDVVIGYATDALLLKYDLVILEDDLELFPPYHGAPLCRNDTLEAHPELKEVLNLLAGKIDDVTMQTLNYQVDIESRNVEDVARDFLVEQGFISE